MSSTGTASKRAAPDVVAHAGEVRELTALLEVSQALSLTLDFRQALTRVLDILGRHHGAIRSTVVLVNEETAAVELEASAGAVSAGYRVRYGVGEGLTGQVLQSGAPIVVPRVSREPNLLNGGADRPELREQERSYICAPIAFEGCTVGVIGLDLLHKEDRDYDRTTKFLGMVGSMIARAVKAHRLIQVERRSLIAEVTQLRQELQERYDFSNLVGTSGPMRRVLDQVSQVARTNTTVLLRGEAGTGKELIAHAIHYNSSRARQPFIKVSCAALPHELVESELFGYEKGAFTGATTSRKGRLELAAGGTLFLDEIGDLGAGTQVKLLRVLRDREFERLGGTGTIGVDVRLVAATNKDLEGAIAAGQLREDLFSRLTVFTIFVPPLRERTPDILLLVDHFVEKFSREHGKKVKRVSTAAIERLTSYHWPGNIRELGHVIERAVVVCDGSAVHAHHLPPALQAAEASGPGQTAPLRESLEAFERDALVDALKSAKGNRAKASRILATTERIFNYRVRKYGIDWRRFKG
jgi:Nif-specific regulatory protein